MHDYAAVLQATEPTRVAAVLPAETRSETSSPASTEMPAVAPTTLASVAPAMQPMPPAAEAAVEPPPALPESERESGPEPTLTVDANGLPRISGFQHNAPKPIVDLVEAMAPTYQLAPELVLAFMQAESSYNPNALSPKNARGLMQLIPGTAERFNVRKPFDPKQNIRGGMAYLRWLLAYFEGDLRLVAAGYNAGERRVDRYLGVPPFGETRAYVKRVVDALGIEAHPFDPNITEPSARLEQIRASRARP